LSTNQVVEQEAGFERKPPVRKPTLGRWLAEGGCLATGPHTWTDTPTLGQFPQTLGQFPQTLGQFPQTLGHLRQHLDTYANTWTLTPTLGHLRQHLDRYGPWPVRRWRVRLTGKHWGSRRTCPAALADAAGWHGRNGLPVLVADGVNLATIQAIVRGTSVDSAAMHFDVKP
jgi:hypothetical protein